MRTSPDAGGPRPLDETAAVWEGIWQRQRAQGPRRAARSSIASRLVGKVKALCQPDTLSLLMFRVVQKEIVRELGGLHVHALMPGAGSGQSSLQLARGAASSTLLDISESAVSLARDLFDRRGIAGRHVCASLFDMPFEDGSFDVVWNVGVMEHFPEPRRIEGLKEMHRVCRRDGLLITAVPSTRSRVYLAAKAFAERRGYWELGYEEPISSMRAAFGEVPGCRVLREYSVGFLWQFWPCRHVLKTIPHARARRLALLAFAGVFEVLNRALWPLNLLPGSWLVTVCRKEN